MNFTDIEKDTIKLLGPVDIMRAVNARLEFEKDVTDQIKQRAIEVKIPSRDRLYDIEIFISPDLSGDYFEIEFRIEAAIKEWCLKELRKKDAIKDFSITTEETLDDIPENVITAKVLFNPQNFLKIVRGKVIDQPKLVAKDGRYYLQVFEEKEILIGKEGSNPVILLTSLPNQNMATIEYLYDEMTKELRNKPNLQLMNPEQKIKEMLIPITNALKEVQKVLNPYYTTYLWKDDKRFPKRVGLFFQKKKSKNTKVGK